jgi:hypothetical protein
VVEATQVHHGPPRVAVCVGCHRRIEAAKRRDGGAA